MTANKTIITIEKDNKKLIYYVPYISVNSIMEYDLKKNRVTDLIIEASGEDIEFIIEESTGLN